MTKKRQYTKVGNSSSLRRMRQPLLTECHSFFHGWWRRLERSRFRISVVPQTLKTKIFRKKVRRIWINITNFWNFFSQDMVKFFSKFSKKYFYDLLKIFAKVASNWTRNNYKIFFKNDFLIGLDLIKEFRLCQDENLKIFQRQASEVKVLKKSHQSCNTIVRDFLTYIYIFL